MGYNIEEIKDIFEELGLNEESREVGVPILKVENDKGSDIELGMSAAKQYRGIIARMNYLRQDLSQIQFAVKELSRSMAKPSEETEDD